MLLHPFLITFSNFVKQIFFQTTVHTKKYVRDFRHFNKREFNEEIGNINWGGIINDTNGTVELHTVLQQNRGNIRLHGTLSKCHKNK